MRKAIQSLVILGSLLGGVAHAQDTAEIQTAVDGLSDAFAKDVALRWKWKGDFRVRNENIDQELSAPRYRASEIVGSLLVHAARLVGRSERGGKVMVQTHSVDSPVLQAMTTLRIDQYLQSVSEMSNFMKLPPFGALAQLSGTNIDDAIHELQKNVFVNVSAASDGSYLVKASDWQVLADALSEIEPAKGVRLKVQVDPARV